jgi:hypothetical protein
MAVGLLQGGCGGAKAAGWQGRRATGVARLAAPSHTAWTAPLVAKHMQLEAHNPLARPEQVGGLLNL